MLSDKTIKALKPQEKPFKVADEKGLHLLVTPAGGKLCGDLPPKNSLPTVT